MIKKCFNNFIYLFCLVGSMFVIPGLFDKLLNYFKLSDHLIMMISNLLFLFMLIFYFKDTLIKDYKDFKINGKKYLGIGIKYWAIGMLVLFSSNLIINLFIFPGGLAGNEQAARSMILSAPIISFISMVFIAPISEELIFRAGFKKVINNKWLFVLSSGLIFAFLHVVTDLSPFLKIIYLIPYASLGVSLAFMHYKTNNIYTSVLIHFIHNFLTFSLIYSVTRYL
ncbi:MAG: type II CAAX endopeptidase family protein [Bacilli bacterium]